MLASWIFCSNFISFHFHELGAFGIVYKLIRVIEVFVRLIQLSMDIRETSFDAWVEKLILR